MARNRWWWAVALWVLVAGVPGKALAYADAIHELFPERALQGDPRLQNEVLAAVSAEELVAFRMFVDGLFRNHPDEKVRAEYVKRWPTQASFDASAFKRLMSLNAQKKVNGFDVADGLPGTALQAMQKGSSQPDRDWRNRERFALDEKGEPMKLPDGRPVPADPLILNMGNVTGLSSQAHAHYGLPDVKLTNDPDVLKGDSRRFAVAAGWPEGPVKGFAREQAQLHYDLAVLAALWNTPAGRSLSRLFLGHAMHYVGDVGNQVHTVQVGYDDFFVTAKLITTERALKTLGGYFGELRPYTAVGIDILTTHHIASERLNEKRIAEALAGKPVPEPVTAALNGLTQDDPQLKSDLEMAMARLVAKGKKRYVPSAHLVAARLIEASSHEGGQVYRHVAGALHPRMTKYGVVFDSETEDPDAVLGDVNNPKVKASLESLYWLQAKAYSRVGTAFRLLHSRYLADATVENEEARAEKTSLVAASLLSTRLSELKGEEDRLAAYLKNPPPAASASVKDPVWLVLPIAVPLLVLACVVLVVKRFRRKAAEEAARRKAELDQLPV